MNGFVEDLEKVVAEIYDLQTRVSTSGGGGGAAGGDVGKLEN